MSKIPSELKYTKDHEWVKLIDNNTILVGITDFAQSELGEIVYVEVDTVGDHLDAEDVFGTVEAVKTTSDLFLPIGGEIIEFNPELDENDGDNPAIINESPYEAWIVKVNIADASELDQLLDAEAYEELVN